MIPSGIDPKPLRSFVRFNVESVTIDMQEQLDRGGLDNRLLLP
jgi:hypothetical protein